MLFWVFIITALFFSSELASAATQKVMWGKAELRVGQIGEVTVSGETPIYQFKNNTFVKTDRTLKKGDEYRVYSYKGQDGGYYGLGGGLYVKKSPKVAKYETPSKAKLELLKKMEQEEQNSNQKPSEPNTDKPDTDDNSEIGKVYPDGWVAPVLKSKWSPIHEENLKTLERELGLTEGGTTFSIPGFPKTIEIKKGITPSVEAQLVLGGYDPDSATAYRVHVILNEIYKLYFEKDAEVLTKQYDEFQSFPNTDEKPLILNGRALTIKISPDWRSLVFDIGYKK